MFSFRYFSPTLLVACLGLAASGDVAAQIPGGQTEQPKIGVGILDQLGAGAKAESDPVQLGGEYSIGKGTRQGRLTVRAQIAPTWHVGSLTQAPGGQLATKIAVEPSPSFQLTRPFVPDRPPHVVQEAEFPGVPSEQYEKEVAWTAAIQIADGVDPTQLKFDVKLSGAVCKSGPGGGCIPILRRPVAIKFAGEYEPPTVGSYQARGAHARLSGRIMPRTAAPGGVVQVEITAAPTSNYHIYAYAERDPQEISKPTLIAWKTRPGWENSPVTPSEAPVEHVTGLKEKPIDYYHERPVTWTVKFKIPDDAVAGGYELRGVIGYQTCTNTGCDAPAGAEFRGVVEIAKLTPDAAAEPLEFARASYSEAAKLAAGLAMPSRPADVSPPAAGSPSSSGTGAAAFDLDRLQPIGSIDKQRSMAIILPMAFLAGFFLNFMPCVLPVIGLKIVSFVHQAGEHRSRIFTLNVWYSAGVIAVFMVLASLAVFAGLSWGDQFRSATFNVVLACVVFAFALSFLGVWEIPLPGFVGSGDANTAAEQEGFAGAFFKGALSTVLATPCGGPMLVPALTWAVSQPPALTYTGFLFVGLGMAFPYLLIGAFPRLISFLPKPGPWMETFKNVMGFVLMGTVVFILTYLRVSLVIPTVATMIGLWAGLWWVGRVPVWDELHKRIRAWAWGMATAVLIGLFSFMWLDDVMESRFQRDVDLALSERMLDQGTGGPAVATNTGTELPWQPYSLARLSDALSNRRTVFVDFTADWCATCKWNEKYRLNVAETKSFVEDNGIVTLKADMTDEAPEADALRARLGGSSLPFYAVFPAAAPYQPIVFDGPISTKSKVIETLNRAVSLGGRTSRELSAGDIVAARTEMSQ
jgi:thiol:disulfide interchange protein